jgi:hypothetical protein
MQMLRDTYRRSRWLMPGFALVLGAVFLVAQWIGGDLAGGVVITVIIGAVMVQLARGEDPSPYAQLGAVGGLAYLVALVGMQRRGI